MKKLALVILMMLPVFCWSQSTNRQSTDAVVISNQQRLNFDFEVKNNSNPDQTLIAQIDLNSYESLRQENMDVEVNDHASGYTLIIYSKNKSFHRKSENTNHLVPLSPNQH
jgi:hypothetical protein